MISCTEFIPAYSEGFKFIENIAGRSELENFWSELSDIYLKDSLEKLMSSEGLAGAYTYWGHALNEEAADFTMILDEDKDEFSIDLHRCPSMAMLLELKHMSPYHSYCDHCPALYRPIVEKFGYIYIHENDCHNATSNITIKRAKK